MNSQPQYHQTNNHVDKRKTKVCRFFMQNRCKKGERCEFIHGSNYSKEYFGNCNNTENNFSHNFAQNKKSQLGSLHSNHLSSSSRHRKIRRKKNTESFKPSHDCPDLQIVIDDAKGKEKYDKVHLDVEAVVTQNLFSDFKSNELYDLLIKEVDDCQQDTTIWKLWHGDTHFIANDRASNWKEQCPTFKMVVQRLATYFDMKVAATRFNWYKNNNEWKPYHHDAAAIKKNKSKVQNITIGVSFGSTREIAFQHAKHRTVVTLPLDDGVVYTFGKKVNIEWRHGIPQRSIENKDSESGNGRVSIILWGSIPLKEWKY